MAPYRIRDTILSDLRKVRTSFFTLEAAVAQDCMSEAEKAEAGEVLVNTNIAIRKLETIQLKEIAGKLREFEQDLTDATKRLNKAVEDLGKFKQVIDAAAGVLSLLGRIANLVGIPLRG